MKKTYVTPEVIVHGTVEDITQNLDFIFGRGGRGGHGGHGGHGHHSGSGPGGPATWPPRRT